ncbi:MAG TPA: CBS domain-containing protein [Gammaproteobacteria bacterium]
MRIQDIMTADPACCTPEMRIRDVARLMLDNDCGEIPVVDDMDSMHLVGVVTDRDIAIRAVAEGKDPTTTNIADIMSSSVVSAKLDDSVEECVELMEENQIRRIPIVDAQGRCCGIVAQADIALRGDSKDTAEVVRDVSRRGGAGDTRSYTHL